MSVSEYYKQAEKKGYSVDLDSDSDVIIPLPASSKKSEYKPREKREKLIASEDDGASVSSKKSKAVATASTTTGRTAAAVKRKAAVKPANKSGTEKRKQWSLFDTDSEDDERVERATDARDLIRSAYSKRVANGVVRHYSQRSGDLLVEVKLYHTADIKGVHPLKRHEKAALALKYQLDHDAPELEPLRKFLKNCKEQFHEEGLFYADKIL